MPSFGEFLANGEVQKWNVTKAQLERSGVKEVQAFRLVTGCLEWESIRNCLNYLDGHVWEWEDTDDDTRRKWRENFLLWLAYAANSIGVDIPKGENGD